MAKEDLILFTDRSEEEVKEMNYEGGKKSGEVRREKRDLKKRITATWELVTKMKKDELKGSLQELLKGDPANPKIQLIKDKIAVLGTGGVELLTIMEIVSDDRTEAQHKLKAIELLLAHEFGKPASNNHVTIKQEWGDGIGKSPAFSGNSILLGIKHGLAKLPLKDLNKVIQMATEESSNRLDEEQDES